MVHCRITCRMLFSITPSRRTQQACKGNAVLSDPLVELKSGPVDGPNWHLHRAQVKVSEQRINVILHDPNALLNEGLPRVSPEHPRLLFVSVLQALGLRWLGDALQDVLATNIPASAWVMVHIWMSCSQHVVHTHLCVVWEEDHPTINCVSHMNESWDTYRGTHIKHIELQAQLLDYFLRSNKSNINQWMSDVFAKYETSHLTADYLWYVIIIKATFIHTGFKRKTIQQWVEKKTGKSTTNACFQRISHVYTM